MIGRPDQGSGLATAPEDRPERAKWGLPHLPDGWAVVDTRHAGPFITRAHLRRPDGRLVEWRSRAHRKRLGLGGDEASTGRRARRPSPSCWWMAGLFAGGSICFAFGSIPLFFNAVASSVVSATFFGGSVLFTTASIIQYDESRAAPSSIGAGATKRPLRQRLLGASPGDLGWWAAAIQLGGTLFFNLSPFAATQSNQDLEQARRLIWAPDLLGSACFLVASWLAFLEANAGARPRPDGSVGWRIAAINLGGSVAFGVSAIAARYLTSGQPANIALVNLGTCLGAVCFLIGAILLPLEAAKGAPVATPST